MKNVIKLPTNNGDDQGKLAVTNTHVQCEGAPPVNRRDIHRIIRKTEIAKPTAEKVEAIHAEMLAINRAIGNNNEKVMRLQRMTAELVDKREALMVEFSRMNHKLYQLQFLVGGGRYNVRFFGSRMGIGCKRIKYADVPKLGAKLLAMMGKAKK